MEKRNIPAAGEFYRHFKGNLYQIIGVAKHSETGEKMVVYQALYGDYSLYTRPLDLFLSPVDREKYPQSVQEYRFEKVRPENGGTSCRESELVIERNSVVTETTKAAKDVRQVEVQKEVRKVQQEVSEEEEEEQNVREEILRFLDAEGAEAKLEVLRQLRKNLDEHLITTIELSMDLLPDERESLERRYELVERTLEQRIRFEGGRLR